MATNEKNITGIGWSFPPTFNAYTKGVQTVTGVEDINQSLSILFTTKPGERILVQKFGCDVNVAMFQNIDLTEKTILENKIRQAIIEYEARIILNAVNIDTSQLSSGMLYIQIDYTIESSNNRQNMVYPFYVGEGTLVPSKM